MALFRRERVRRWVLPFVYIFILYSTLPLGRPLITWARQNFTRAQQSTFIYGLFIVVAIAAIGYVFSLRKKLAPTAWVCMLLFVRLYMHELTLYATYPEERLHFIQYGILAFMLHHALSYDLARFRPRGLWPYVAALILGGLIGWGDEGVQYLTIYIPDVCRFFGIEVHPLTFRRYYDIDDVILNFIGVAYGLAFLATVIRNRRPEYLSAQISHTSSSDATASL